MTYGFQDNVARSFNLSPADADRAIAEAYEIAGGEAAFNWYTRETRRLAATFTGDDAPTELETQFLLELARRADNRGHLEVTPRRTRTGAQLATPRHRRRDHLGSLATVIRLRPHCRWRAVFREAVFAPRLGGLHVDQVMIVSAGYACSGNARIAHSIWDVVGAPANPFSVV